MLFKPFDFGIIFLALAVTAVSFYITYSRSDGTILVNVQGEKGKWVFPADTAESIVVSGPLGDTVVEIGGGFARIKTSPCLNQTCVSAGNIHARGQWTACLPNRVMLYIDKSETNNDVDASAW